MRRALTSSGLFLVLLPACGGGGPTQAEGPTDMAGRTGASPAKVRVKWTSNGTADRAICGTLGIWTVSFDGAPPSHTVECARQAWDSGVVDSTVGDHTATVEIEDGGKTLASRTLDFTALDVSSTMVQNFTLDFTAADF